jgi:hypothetical protein
MESQQQRMALQSLQRHLAQLQGLGRLSEPAAEAPHADTHLRPVRSLALLRPPLTALFP